MQLYQEQGGKASRYQLYKAAEMLYANKVPIEMQLYNVCVCVQEHVLNAQ